jgi:hypothetical protein
MNLAPELPDAACTQPSSTVETEQSARTPTPHTPVDDTTGIAQHNLPVNESMTFQEQTMVEDDVKGEQASQPNGGVDEELEEKGVVDSDSLRNSRPSHFSTDPRHEQDVTIVEEEVEAVNSNGHVLYPDVDTKPSKRTSHLRLDFKPPSPQPWDLVDPPNEESRKDKARFYSVAAPNFPAVQNAR